MEELRVGLTVEKPIKNIMDFGLFVELTKGVDVSFLLSLHSKTLSKT